MRASAELMRLQAAQVSFYLLSIMSTSVLSEKVSVAQGQHFSIEKKAIIHE